MKFIGAILVIMALVFAVASAMSTGGFVQPASAGLQGGQGGPGGPPPGPPPSNITGA